MKHFLTATAFLLLLLQSAQAQNTMSDYAFIVVPQQFDFQREKDQYQINTLMRHLFRNAGFNAIYDIETGMLPECEGLYTDLDVTSVFLGTRLAIEIKDCYDNVVFRSPTISSREKQYRDIYHNTIREAFQSIDALRVNQGDLDSFRESVNKRNTLPEVSQLYEKHRVNVSFDELKQESLKAYTFQGTTFYLDDSAANFILYKKNAGSGTFEKKGVLTPTSREGIYLFDKDGKRVLANFDAAHNLLIDDEDSYGNPVQNKYLKVKGE